jgi:hypothetical protein
MDIQSLHRLLKPSWQRTSRRNGQHTESNALANVNLQQEAAFLAGVQRLASEVYRAEVVVDRATLNKCTLGGMHRLIKYQCQPPGKTLGHKLTKAVHKTNWMVVFDLLSLAFLLEEDHEGLVDQIEAAAIKGPKNLKALTTSCLIIGQATL